MLKLIPLFLFLIVSTFQPIKNTYDFKSDLAKDKKTLKNRHSIIKVNQLKQFEQFQNIRLSAFVFSSTKQRTIELKKWERHSGNLQSFYQIDCQIPIDTVVSFTDIDTKKVTEQIPIKTIYHFRAYIFNKVGNLKRFYYLTETKDGLQETIIDKVHSEIYYEDIGVGLELALQKAEAQIQNILRKK